MCFEFSKLSERKFRGGVSTVTQILGFNVCYLFQIFYFRGLYGHERVVRDFLICFDWSNVQFHYFLATENDVRDI